jgi:hypothetical protein
MKNTKNNEEHSNSNPATWISNHTRFQAIKSKVLFAIKHRSRIQSPFALIIFKSTQFYWKRVSVWNQTLRLKQLKTCYWCTKTLDYCLMMSCDCEDAKKWNKTGQKFITKKMFLGRTWRTATQMFSQKCINLLPNPEMHTEPRNQIFFICTNHIVKVIYIWIKTNNKKITYHGKHVWNPIFQN